MDRIYELESAVQQYVISHLRDDTIITIVSFNHGTKVEVPLTQLTNMTVRQIVAGKVPNNADGGTDIGDGVLKCRAVSNIPKTTFEEDGLVRD